jgi:hypothetical protein
MIVVMSDSTADNPIDHETPFTISCDACAMQATSACADCVVTFLLDEPLARERAPAGGGLDLDPDQARVVQLFGRAGMVPRLRHVAS